MKKYFCLSFSVVACWLLLTSFTQVAKKTKTKHKSGIEMKNLDLSANPATDFYQYACGGWMKLHPLGAEYARYGSFDELAENNQKQLQDLVTKIAAQKNEKGSIAQKVGDLYKIGMDTLALEKQGAQPIQPQLQQIASLKRNRLSQQLAEMELDGLSPFFVLFGFADPDNSSMKMACCWQSGLGVGDRDYYLEKDQQKIRDAYVNLMTQLFVMSGYNQLAGFQGREKEMAMNVLAMETCLAQATINKTILRDPYRSLHKNTAAQFQTMFSELDLATYLNTLQVKADTLNIGQPTYFETVNNLLRITDFEIIKAYLAWNVINAAAPYLSQNFVDAEFDFYGKVLSGRETNQERWKRVLNTMNGCLGEALGQMYVETYFPAEAKARMMQLVKNLQWALGERIKASEWMTDETKAKAIDKLNAFTVKIGYPDKWRDYSDLTIENDSYYANILRARRFAMAYELAKIGKEVDPAEWQMTPQTVNAYYEPTTNEICFPAGILQPPFFDMNADDAANYGAIGVVIGHEMTHGFDDQGRHYDKAGNLADWWNDRDDKAFKERAQRLVDHFNGIEVAPGVYGNGEFTLGENIADNGGLNVSHTALNKAIADGAKIRTEMDGFTIDQRFFLAYANVWAANIRPEEILRRTKVDPHSLGMWRVNGTLPHIDAFYEAFHVQKTDKMWLAPEKRAKIW